jgi:hypothetical protein
MERDRKISERNGSDSGGRGRSQFENLSKQRSAGAMGESK